MSAKRIVRRAGPIVREEKRLPDQSCLRLKRDVCGGIQATVCRIGARQIQISWISNFEKCTVRRLPVRTNMTSKGIPKIMSPRIRNAFLYFAASLLACIALISISAPAFAQTTESSGEQAQEAQWTSGTSPSSDQGPESQEQPSTQSVICGVKHLGRCLKDIGHDQAGIWTSPLRIAPRDAIWLVPFAAGTGVALHYDAQAQQNLGIDQSRIDASNIISGFGSPYATLGGAAGLYFLGLGTHNEHLAETGRLGAEAVIDSVLVVAALKLATNRERPNEGNGQGGFWPHGTRSYELDGSFPSGHAAESFALARVIASEYPSKPVQIAAYAFALAISASRVTARQHFPSDVLVGGTFGYLIGGYVVRHHAAQGVDSGFSFVPVVHMSTHTFGASVALRPDQIDLARVGRLMNRIRLK
jgi:membrane-associated phospholipid phosphatase